MDSIFYSLTPASLSSLGACSSFIGGGLVPLLALETDVANEKELFLTLFVSYTTAGLGGCEMLIAHSYEEDMQVAEQYVYSLSKEELEQLADELTLISANQETNVLVQQMDLIEQTELAGEVDSDILNSKRQEVISDYLNSLTIGEISEISSELDVTNFLPPEKKLEKQLSLIKK